MNREDTKKCIEVMQAFVDGNAPQQKASSGDYGVPISPQWNWDNDADMYRAIPNPREWWLNLTEGDFIEADKGSKYWGAENELVKVIEDIK